MINGIISEAKHCFWIVVIISFGMIWCDLGNREALWEDKYQSWTYNTDCPIPDGFSRAVIDPDKCN